MRRRGGPPGLRQWNRSDVVSPDRTRIGLVSAGSGPPVVLVHGSLSDHAATWGGVAPILAATMRVHLYDRRGRGLSADGRPGTLDEDAADLVAVVESASAAAGGGPVAVVAHSWGAHISLRAAAACDHIACVVAYEPPHPYSCDRRRELRRLIDAGDWDAFLRAFLRLPPERLEGLRVTERWREMLGLAPSTGSDVASFLEADLSRSRFEAVTAPVLVLVGERSAPERHRFLGDLAAWMPRAALDVLPGHGHFAMRDDPAMFSERVAAFMAGGPACVPERDMSRNGVGNDP